MFDRSTRRIQSTSELIHIKNEQFHLQIQLLIILIYCPIKMSSHHALKREVLREYPDTILTRVLIWFLLKFYWVQCWYAYTTGIKYNTCIVGSRRLSFLDTLMVCNFLWGGYTKYFIWSGRGNIGWESAQLNIWTEAFTKYRSSPSELMSGNLLSASTSSSN